MEQITVTESATSAVGKINRNFANVNSEPEVVGESVFLGNFVQNGNWARQQDILCPVDYGITYTFTMPEGIVAKIEYGTTNSLGSTSVNIFDGDTFTFPQAALAQRISFARYQNGTVALLTVADAQSMIDSGSIRVSFDDADVVEHNRDKESMLAALTKLSFNESNSTSSQYYYKRAALIAHTSDLHGDAQRAYNMMRYAKHYGIDECVVSGDATLYSKDGADYVFAAAKNAGVHVLFSMGNHEAQGLTPSAGVMFSTYLSNDAERLGYLKAADTITDRGYYYYDLSAKKIRFIVLDQYDGGVYGGQGKAGRISQGQVDFLLNALRAPAGYGIVVIMHSPENSLSKPTELAKFNTSTPLSGNNGDNYSYASSGSYNDTSRPISKIIDAFISRSTYSGSWTATYNGASETVNVNADFTEYDSSVEFICYLSGHIHTDNIGYLSGTSNRQLMINITSGNGHVSGGDNFGFSGIDDIPRRGVGVTQDAFNVYAIDREKKQVRILRIGSNVKKDMTMRDFLIADYSPSAS